MDLGVQRQMVGRWLDEVFGDDLVPEFELNAKIIQQLYQMVLTSQSKDRKIMLLIDDLNQKINEYNIEAQRLSAILTRLGLGHTSLSKPVANNVWMLAKLGTLLSIKDASDTCYYLALQLLDNELEKVMQERKMEANQLEQLSSKSYSVMLKYSNLKKTLDDLKEKADKEQEANDKRKSETAFVLGKAKNYEKEIIKYQKQLARTQVDESIFHEKLVEKSEYLKSLQAKVAPLQTELQAYASLPPDLTETKIKIEQQRQELARLEKEFMDSLDVHRL